MSSRKRYAKWQNNQTPAKWFKRFHNKMEKTNFIKQLNQWKNNGDFEIVNQTRRSSAKWDWN